MFIYWEKKLTKMLRIKRVPTVVSNYQKEEAGEAARRVGGCGRNCLKSCCIQGNCCIACMIDFLVQVVIFFFFCC